MHNCLYCNERVDDDDGLVIGSPTCVIYPDGWLCMTCYSKHDEPVWPYAKKIIGHRLNNGMIATLDAANDVAPHRTRTESIVTDPVMMARIWIYSLWNVHHILTYAEQDTIIGWLHRR